MRQFNAPPEWPAPPRPDWRPPRRWQPPETWPPPPRRWAFWVDEDGRPVRGPIGRYGGPRRTTTLAIVVVPLTLMVVVLLNPFGSSEQTSTAPLYRATPLPASPVTRTPTPAPRRTEQPVRLIASTPTPADERTTERRTPTPTPTPTPAPTPTMTPTPAPPATPAQVVYKNCAEVRAAGKAPLRRGDPGYTEQLDHNGDGVACDRGNS